MFLFPRILIISLIVCPFVLSAPCDYTCKTCRLIFVFTFCAECTTDRYYDQITDQCSCKPYHTDINQTCQSCPNFCYTCSQNKTCLSCSQESYRQVKNGSCICKDGYEQQNSQELCIQKQTTSSVNLWVIIGTTLGAICFVLAICCCFLIIFRRLNTVQIHDQNPRRRSLFIMNNRLRNRQQADEPIQNDQSISDKASQLEKSQVSMEFKAEQVCSICLDDNALYITECGHYFHLKCISQWLQKKSRTCPNCNRKTKLKRLKKWCRKCYRNTIPYYENSDFCEGCQGCEHIIIY